MSKRSISTLNPGDKVNLKFGGSKQLGNDTYTETNVAFIRYYTEDGVKYAEFDSFTAYFAENRWRYGTSASVLTLI